MSEVAVGEVRGLLVPNRLLAGKEELASSGESVMLLGPDPDSDFFLLSALPLRFLYFFKRSLRKIGKIRIISMGYSLFIRILSR